MNNFTKEELEELLDCIHWKINEGQEEKLTEIVDKKIQSMIENYDKKNSCVHEYVMIHTNPNIHDWGDETYYKCINCGRRKDE